ncbi:zf-DHHC-domain-containing protein [Guyanagaster necrorhizus]|uniref:Palmitoyltransferase n=1 Tax=Guyanagaster necrorhizus TaxID=856835 RepID=A0A9P7W257_9AGAR|nr:zf-DHHC-domain-containing protein [Guyanagaster necrorhizus MCA 3950]KAG7451015.1 zf-DHHC-domain-containing protein [Guyanagaster necrorhizus MCA 3950]
MSPICRIVEDAKYQTREKRAARRAKQQPWIVLKLMVFITAAIMIYGAYVYIARFCVPGIRREHAFISRGASIVMLVVFCPLYFWMLWAYIMVVVVSPGYARDHVPRSPQPPPLPQIPFVPPIRPPPSLTGPNTDVESGAMGNPARIGDGSIGGPSYEEMSIHNPRPLHDSNETHEGVTYNNYAMNSSPVLASTSPPPQTDGNWAEDKDLDFRIRMSMMHIERRPPTNPVLLPAYRYCTRDELIKPYRAHHCSACGTCVLKYDHHCPWIGQCVGARNHKFFINFNQATAVFTAYTFATLLTYTIRAAKAPGGDLDAQQIVAIALSALFFIFSATLFVTHVRLLYLSQTTVEAMYDRSMKEREGHILNDAFGLCGFIEKIRVQRLWDAEWGRIGREGNLWWLGSGRKGWEDVMGDWWVGWIFPVGRGLSDGLNYTTNPRFDETGRWRKRKEWPVGLQ